jgi:hypothetical protein
MKEWEKVYARNNGPPQPEDRLDGRPSVGANDKLLEKLSKVHKQPRYDRVELDWSLRSRSSTPVSHSPEKRNNK